MVDWTGTTVQIVIALIGSSSVFVAGLGGYFSELNKPDINVELLESEDLSSIIELTNVGNKPATNLVLTVNTHDISPKSIEIFSTENISGPEVSSKSIRINAPRLVQGDGSIVRLILLNVTENSIDNVYATYDQGSATLPKQMDWIDTLVTILSYIGWSLLILVGGGLSAFLIYLLYNRRKGKKEMKEERELLKQKQKKNRKDFLQKILTHMIRVRSILYVDIDTTASFEEEQKFWDSNQIDEKLQIINHVGDLISIEDFYTVLKTRNSYLRSSPGSGMPVKGKPNEDIDSREPVEKPIRSHNEKCLNSVENVLKVTDWGKYDIITEAT
jgi:hypothetical protein